MRFQFLIVLIVLGLSLTGYSQEKQHYLDVHPGWSHSLVKDDGVSQMIYKGSSFFIQGAYEKVTPVIIHRVGVSFRYGKMRSGIYPQRTSSELTQIQPEINYSFLFRVKKMKDTSLVLYCGGSFSHNYLFYYHNSFSNNSTFSNYITTLAVKARMGKYFRIKSRKLQGIAEIELPVMGFITRPSFASSRFEHQLSNEDNYFNDILKSGEFKTPGKFQEVFFRTSLRYFLKNGNILAINYLWNYLHDKKLNELYFASHAVSFSTIFKF